MSSDNGSNFGNVGSPTNSNTYQPTGLQQTTLFRCEVISVCGNANSSNTVRDSVRPEFKAGRIATKDTTVCSNSNLNFIVASDSSASGGGGPISYRWYMNSSPMGVGRSSDTLRLDANLLKFGNTYTFTREAMDTACKTWKSSTGDWKITVWDTLKAGGITTGRDTVCFNGFNRLPRKITQSGTGAAQGGSGIYAYRWVKVGDGNTITIDSNTFEHIPDASQSGIFTYYREVRDNICGGWKRSAGTYTLTVRDAFTAGEISSVGEVIICESGNPTVTISELITASGGDNVFTYRWLENGIIIPNETAAVYTPAETAVGTYTYTRGVQNAVCASDWLSSDGSWTLVVNPDANIAMPCGADLLYQKADTVTTYYIPFITDAKNYEWELSPSSSGLVLANGNSVSIRWEDNFTGQCNLRVKVELACDATIISDELVITVNPYVGIVETHCNASLPRICPNPTDGMLRITRYALQENTTIEIDDIYGIILLSMPAIQSPEPTVDISHLAAGIYFMRIGEKTIKIIKH
jgi:hypothetical protein